MSTRSQSNAGRRTLCTSFRPQTSLEEHRLDCQSDDTGWRVLVAMFKLKTTCRHAIVWRERGRVEITFDSRPTEDPSQTNVYQKPRGHLTHLLELKMQLQYALLDSSETVLRIGRGSRSDACSETYLIEAALKAAVSLGAVIPFFIDDPESDILVWRASDETD